MAAIFTAIDGTMFVVKRSQSKMPNSCWGRYSHSAVLRVDAGGSIPGCIRDTRTAKVLWDSGPGFQGSTSRCQAERDNDRAYDLAREYVASRNARVNNERTIGYVEQMQNRSDEI